MPDPSISEYMKIRRYVMNLIYRTKGKAVQVPTILELSKQFGVSRPTVSKAMKALTDEGYIIGKRGIGSFTNPNFHIQLSNPLMKKTPVIGILVGDGMGVYYSMYHSQLLGNLMAEFGKRFAFQRHFSLSSSDPDVIYQEIQNEQLDALFWFDPDEKRLPVCHRLKKEHFPLVVGGRKCDGIPTVDFDFEDIGYQCGRLLLAQGRRNIVFFPNVYPWTRESTGLLRAYREAGITLNENLFLEDFYDVHKKITDILSYGIPIDAIYGQLMTHNEIEDYLYQADPGIPERCTVISSGITMPSKNPFHRIEFSLPFTEFAKEAALQMEKVLAGNTEGKEILLKISLLTAKESGK